MRGVDYVGMDLHKKESQLCILHDIFLTAFEVMGPRPRTRSRRRRSTPPERSKGYDLAGPGEADENAATRWEVSTYRFYDGSAVSYRAARRRFPSATPTARRARPPSEGCPSHWARALPAARSRPGS